MTIVYCFNSNLKKNENDERMKILKGTPDDTKQKKRIQQLIDKK
jgi:hypothetical protein